MTDGFKFRWSTAFSRSDVPSEARAVAYVIFNHSDGDGKNSYPSTAAMMVDTGNSEPTVRRHLRTLKASGWVNLVSSGSNSGRRALASVYELSYPRGYSEQEANDRRDAEIAAARKRLEDAAKRPKKRREHRSPVNGDSPQDQGTPITDERDHRSLMTGSPIMGEPLPEPLPNPEPDPPLDKGEEEGDVLSLYSETDMEAVDSETLMYLRLTELLDKGHARSARTDAEHQELIDAGFTHVDAPRFSVKGGPAGGWTDPSPEFASRRRDVIDAHNARLKERDDRRKAIERGRWEEMQRVEAEARAERDRQAEAERAQREAQASTRKLAELKAIEWVARSWDRFEQFCVDENVGLDRQLTLAQRAKEKATSSPFGLFKTMVSNGVDPVSKTDWNLVGSAPSSGRMWQE